MKIVDLDTFLATGNGTIFQKYEPCYFGALGIKEENCGTRDFIASDLTGMPIDAHDTGDLVAQLDRAEANGISVALNFTNASRDGCFEANQLFAVWERSDIEALIARLVGALDKMLAA